MKPLRNNVIVEYIDAKKETSSGIILKSSNEPARAKIIEIGPEVTEVAIGEIALVDWNRATKIKDQTYCISVNDIVFVYEE